MTNREFLTAIANSTVLPTDLTDFAAEQITKLNARNEARKASSKPSKTAIANEPIKASIMAFLSQQNEPVIACTVAEGVGFSTAKASSLLRQLVEGGKVVKSEVKIPKKGKTAAYAVALTESADEDTDAE